MYRGVTQLKVDGKGRMALPTRYREELFERCGGSLVATVNTTAKQCLWMYPLDEWERVEKQVNQLGMKPEHIDFTRYFIGYATDMKMDKTGRVLLSRELREFARIEKEIYLVGQGDKFEIWNAREWEAGRDDWLNKSAGDIILTPEMEELRL